MPWYNPIDWFAGTDAAVAANKEADAKLAELNNKDYAPGGRVYNKIVAENTAQGTTPEEQAFNDYLAQAAALDAQQQVQQHIQDAASQDYAGQIHDAAVEGLAQGYSNVTGAIKSTINAPFKFAWDIIPWWIYVAAAVALFLYMGGGVWLKGRIAK